MDMAMAMAMEASLVHTTSSSSSSSCCLSRRPSGLFQPNSSFFPRLPSSSLPRLTRHPVFFVRAAKGKRRYGSGVPQQRNSPLLPKLEDDGNPKFVIFVRDKRVPLWFPLNVVTGGSLAKMVVTAMGNSWGKNMAQGTLTRDLGNAIYKDERMIRTTAIKNHSVLKTATDFEYGYKIVDMNNQKAAFSPANVTKIPPREELKTVVDKVKGFFGGGVSSLKESIGNLKLGGQEASNISGEDSDSK